ncbi:MAG: helix-hairpin-helix domain-containing protein [Bacteroidales bacterium]|jgi:DNA uptake protein ComE-like DNA-binding protein|nr:helix-hairpin-helix domain-containing protein [Bacteroidales bacterium]
MNWRDFLYFSKGERRALTLLLLLIFAGSLWLVIHDKYSAEEVVAETPPRYIVNPENAPLPISVDVDTTPRPVATPPPPQKKYSPRREPQPASFTRTEKFPPGTMVELNTADTTTLKKVPGIGSYFAGRIVKYRALLGGFYCVEQLREVYGMEEERYLSLQNWFYADTSFIAKLPVNLLPREALAKHPYIGNKKASILQQLRRKKGRLHGWHCLRLLEEFTEADRERLHFYLSFQ